jgi:glutathione S-transferase
MTYNGREGIQTGFEVFYSQLTSSPASSRKDEMNLLLSSHIKIVSEHVYETLGLGGVMFRVWSAAACGVSNVVETIHFNNEGLITHHISTLSSVQHSNITFRYWPIQGRGLGISLMLEDSGLEYERQVHDGSPIDGTVVAVPAVNIQGEWLSQSMVCMIAIGDELGFAQAPRQHKPKPRQALLNLFDVQEEAFKKRVAIKTVAEAQEWLNTRAAQFFRAVEHMYKQFEGEYYLGDKPSVVDFQLVSCITIFNYAFGSDVVEKSLRGVAPTCYNAYLSMVNRPRIKRYIESGYGGYPIYTPSAKMSAEHLT